jgi:hypothetical protein
MRERIVLLGDRNALEKGKGLDPPLTRIQDFSHGLEVVGAQDLRGQIGSPQERPERGGRSLRIFLRDVKQERP